MPDAWEVSKGLDPKDASDGSQDANHDGYTHVEDYLNSLALPYYDATPSISIVRPERNELFITSTTATIEVEAYANDYNDGSIMDLELYFDEQLVKKASQSNRIAATLTAVPRGKHHITVKATDNTGNLSTDTTTVYVGTRAVRVTIEEDARHGQVTLKPEGGVYVDGIDVNIEAIPDEGYRFHAWIKDLESDQKQLTIKTAEDITLKAVFKSNEDPIDKYNEPIRITFGPLEGFYAPPGYLVDGGSPYSEKLNGHTYGWLGGYNLSGSHDPSESNLVLATHNVFETESGSYSWGLALPKGFYNVKLGLGAKQAQRSIKVNLGQLRSDIPPLVLNDSIETDKVEEYQFENMEIKDGGSYSDSRLTLSSAIRLKSISLRSKP